MSLFWPNSVCTSSLVTAAYLLTARAIYPFSILTVSYVPLHTPIFGHSIAPFFLPVLPQSRTTQPKPLIRPFANLWGKKIRMSDLYTAHRQFSTTPKVKIWDQWTLIWSFENIKYVNYPQNTDFNLLPIEY